MSSDAWQPDRYERFAAERRMPFDELVALCKPVDGNGSVYDLGCGPGTLTAELPARLESTMVIGVDSSPAMLDKARPLADGRTDLRFEVGDLASFEPTDPPAIIFSNAALHWVDHHANVLNHWRGLLAPHGQIAVQVPTNHDHPAYPLAAAVALEHPEWFPTGPPALPSTTVLAPEQYAEILYGMGAERLHVSLRVFTHELDDTATIVDWVSSTTLNPYRQAMHGRTDDGRSRDDDHRFDAFCDAYRTRLVAELGSREPYLFTFKRILFWARFP
jgi:trans-aconitate 2-methyltransferase